MYASEIAVEEDVTTYPICDTIIVDIDRVIIILYPHAILNRGDVAPLMFSNHNRLEYK